MDSSRSKEFLLKCRNRLIEKKDECLLGLEELRNSEQLEYRGDEADLSFVTHQRTVMSERERKLKNLLLSIDRALRKMQRGVYGICEETEEPIEEERLLVLPWTTLSIEGAEAREKVQRTMAGDNSAARLPAGFAAL